MTSLREDLKRHMDQTRNAESELRWRYEKVLELAGRIDSSGWKPIEMCPRVPERSYLIYSNRYGRDSFDVGVFAHSTGQWIAGDGATEPTHWQDLPPPPIQFSNPSERSAPKDGDE